MSRHGAPNNGALARGEHERWQLDCSRLQGRLDTAIRLLAAISLRATVQAECHATAPALRTDLPRSAEGAVIARRPNAPKRACVVRWTPVRRSTSASLSGIAP